MKTAGSWGGAEGALGAEREGREGLAQRGAGLRVTPAGTVAALITVSGVTLALCLRWRTCTFLRK